MRAIVGAGIALVTPGIRPAGADIGDQKRVDDAGSRRSAPAPTISSSAGRSSQAADPQGGRRGDRRRDRRAAGS